jgi:hypothetical protein
MYNDSINRTSTHDNLGSLIAEKLHNNRVFLLFCLKKNGDSRFVQSSFMCSYRVPLDMSENRNHWQSLTHSFICDSYWLHM